jgi:hypothetical protein
MTYQNYIGSGVKKDRSEMFMQTMTDASDGIEELKRVCSATTCMSKQGDREGLADRRIDCPVVQRCCW